MRMSDQPVSIFFFFFEWAYNVAYKTHTPTCAPKEIQIPTSHQISLWERLRYN